MYPGIVFYISRCVLQAINKFDISYNLRSWYKRSETGTKVAIFFSSATIAGAFSELASSFEMGEA